MESPLFTLAFNLIFGVYRFVCLFVGIGNFDCVAGLSAQNFEPVTTPTIFIPHVTDLTGRKPFAAARGAAIRRSILKRFERD